MCRLWAYGRDEGPRGGRAAAIAYTPIETAKLNGVDATGNEDMKRDGQKDQAEGKVQKGVGDAMDKLSDDK